MFYVGISTNIKTGEFYVFKRKGDYRVDEYWGSGSYPSKFSLDEKRRIFARKILQEFKTSIEAADYETKCIYKLISDPLCMNKKELI